MAPRGDDFDPRASPLGGAGVRRRRALAHRGFIPLGFILGFEAAAPLVASRRQHPRLRRLGRARRAGLRDLVSLALALLRPAAADDVLRQGADPEAAPSPRLGVRARRDERQRLAGAGAAGVAGAGRAQADRGAGAAGVRGDPPRLRPARRRRLDALWPLPAAAAAGGAGAGSVGWPVDRRLPSAPCSGARRWCCCCYRWRRWRSWCTGPSGTSPPNRCSR